MNDSTNLITAARRYPYLQGLLLVPIGLWLATLTLTSSGWWPWKGGMPSRELAVMIPATALAAWACSRAAHLYQERFGRVVLRRQQQVRDGVAALVGVLVLAAAQVADWSVRGPVNFTAIAFTLLALGFWKHAGVLGREHVGLALGVVALSLMPWTTVRSSGAPTTVLGLAMAGMIVIAGLLDHAHLVRWLGPVDDPDTSNGSTSAGA